MKQISFADVVHPFLTFNERDESQGLVLKLIDSKWFQRLRDVSQTASTRLVYMFSEHSRFGHCIGAAYLACQVMNRLEAEAKDTISPYKNAVAAAAILHDIGHLAPGSHIAQRIWFPNEPDTHELIGARIILEDQEIQGILSSHENNLAQDVANILKEDSCMPPWTWELISGGGWNVDRGNWCSVDSVMSGVSYGTYNIRALTDSIIITSDKHLALKENRIDAMVHFAISRHAMYRQIYQHRVLLAADTLSIALIKRARVLHIQEELTFADALMQKVLSVHNADELSLDDIFWMREAWWRYHLHHWSQCEDEILSDLSTRIIQRKLFKTVRILPEEDPEVLKREARALLEKEGLDPEYYLHHVSTSDVNSGDSKQSMLVERVDGKLMELREADPVFDSLVNTQLAETRSWIVVPEKVKTLLGRTR